MEDIRNYDSWKLANGQDKAKKSIGNCEHCGDPIYYGDEVRYTSEGDVHNECFDDFAKEMLGSSYPSTAGE